MQILFPLILKLVLHFSCFISFQDLPPFSLPSTGCILLHCMNLPDFMYPMVYSWTSRCLFWYYKLYYCKCPYVSTCSHKREFISERSSWKWKGVGKRHLHGALWLPLHTPLCWWCQFILNTAALRALSLHAAQPQKVLVTPEYIWMELCFVCSSSCSCVRLAHHFHFWDPFKGSRVWAIQLQMDYGWMQYWKVSSSNFSLQKKVV